MLFSRLSKHGRVTERTVTCPLGAWTKLADANPNRVFIRIVTTDVPGTPGVMTTTDQRSSLVGGDSLLSTLDSFSGPGAEFLVTQQWYGHPSAGAAVPSIQYVTEVFLDEWPCLNYPVSQSPYHPSDDTEQPTILDTNPPSKPFDLPPVVTTELENGPS